MRKKGTIFVPTRHIAEVSAANPDLPPEIRKKLLLVIERSRGLFKMAFKEGVKIGTFKATKIY